MLKKNAFLLISILLHLIVLYILAQSVMFPSVPDSSVKKPDIIQATLLFELPTKPKPIPVEIIEPEKPQPVEPEAQVPIIETAENKQIEPISEPQVQPPPAVTQPQEPPEKQEEQVPEVPEEINNILITDKKTPSNVQSDIRAPVTSMARRHLNSFQQQQRNKVAEQASRYYQQHKNSPVIDDEVKNPFMTEDEKLRGSLKVRADCSNTSKKITAVLLGLLGGQIDCSKPPPINSFIQNRLNKESHLSGRKPTKAKKRPQSIVIKEQP